MENNKVKVGSKLYDFYTGKVYATVIKVLKQTCHIEKTDGSIKKGYSLAAANSEIK